MKVYALFRNDTDGYTYSHEVLLGIYENSLRAEDGKQEYITSLATIVDPNSLVIVQIELDTLNLDEIWS